jgi:diaminohydroxyphosphoribosylaminopyrimidine deaminase/5-amino-6-(5-phosphoribosylamino)uracil reductase
MSSAAFDHSLMALAIALARRGLGNTAPNPSVGAVIADEASGEIVARAWTRPGGRPHAETEALRLAGPQAHGATLYVTLEPCSHHGRTPPCAEAVIAAGIRRVVAANLDPDVRVAGRGFDMLRRAGIEVATGVREEEAWWVHAGHMLRVTQGIPFVQLKIAVGCDGRIAPGDGKPRWVTGPVARAMAHLLRARTDAILVGRGTILADDPQLTCRLPGLEARSPHRFVLDTSARTPLASAVVRGAVLTPTTIIAADASTALPTAIGAARVSRVAAGRNGKPSPVAVLHRLAEDGITRLLIEGGPHVTRAFLDAGLVHEVALFTGAAPAGDGGLLPLVDRDTGCFADTSQWTQVADQALGPDRMQVYRRAGLPQ